MVTRGVLNDASKKVNGTHRCRRRQSGPKPGTRISPRILHLEPPELPDDDLQPHIRNQERHNTASLPLPSTNRSKMDRSGPAAQPPKPPPLQPTTPQPPHRRPGQTQGLELGAPDPPRWRLPGPASSDATPVAEDAGHHPRGCAAAHHRGHHPSSRRRSAVGSSGAAAPASTRQSARRRLTRQSQPPAPRERENPHHLRRRGPPPPRQRPTAAAAEGHGGGARGWGLGFPPGAA